MQATHDRTMQTTHERSVSKMPRSTSEAQIASPSEAQISSQMATLSFAESEPCTLRHSGLANRRVARKPCWRRASIGGADVWKARDGRLVLSIDLGVGVTAVTAHYGPLAGLAVLRTVQGLQPNVTATRRSRAHSAQAIRHGQCADRPPSPHLWKVKKL